MKIAKKKINGKEYVYASDYIYVTTGNRILKNKSLGPVDSFDEVGAKKKQLEFEKVIVAEEKKLRTEYWSTYIQNKRFSKYVDIAKIENIRTDLYKAKEQIGPVGQSAMETAFLVDFIYNSNAIEGSKIPREVVAKRVQQSLKKNDEVGNTARAIYYANNELQMSINGIQKLQAILLEHEPQHIGLRTERVVVGNEFFTEEVADWRQIKEELQGLLSWYAEAKKTWYPPELAFTFYYRFERIHPFADGNGRTGRLLMNKILNDHRYHPIIIWNKRRTAHMNAFRSFQKGKEEQYFKFMVQQFMKTHRVYLQKLHAAIDFEELSRVFLEPSE